MKYLIVGDVHGKLMQFEGILQNNLNSNVIQVGDMGLGYGGGKNRDNFFNVLQNEHPSLRFIRGNHDNPAICNQMKSNFDAEFLNEKQIMGVGGASSIDRAWNIAGDSWWEDEQFSDEEFTELFEQYKNVKPRVMITHTAPSSVCEQLFGVGAKDSRMQWIGDALLGNQRGHNTGCAFGEIPRTEMWLERFFEAHQPEYWFFGHWHMSRQAVINGTHFQCLNELETFELELK